MLVVDIPRYHRSSEHFRVGVIGSCRIRDLFIEAYKLDPKPPESVGAPECPLVWYRFSAFNHTLPQALQYYRFITGQIQIPEELHPFVFSQNVTPAVQKRISTLTPEIIDSIDLFAVEVSTKRDFSVGDFMLNSSYTETKLIRAGGKPLLKWWRSVAQPNEDHLSVVQKTLEALPSNHIQDSVQIRSVIGEGRWQTQSSEGLAVSLLKLMDSLGKPVAIVPAFNDPDNLDNSGVELTEELQTLSVLKGCHFFDPTSVVASANRQSALKGGKDTKHYEPGFHYKLLKSVVPFLQDAVSLHERTGKFSTSRYQPIQYLKNTAA